MNKLTDIKPPTPFGYREVEIPIIVPSKFTIDKDGSCLEVDEVLKNYPPGAFIYSYLNPPEDVYCTWKTRPDYRIPQIRLSVIYYEKIQTIY